MILLGWLLFAFWVVLIFRMCAECVYPFTHEAFRGPMAVLSEAMFVVSDPVVKPLRRILPALHVGAMRFDMALVVLLLATYVGERLAFAAAGS